MSELSPWQLPKAGCGSAKVKLKKYVCFLFLPSVVAPSVIEENISKIWDASINGT